MGLKGFRKPRVEQNVGVKKAEIRRPGLGPKGKLVTVSQVHLVYDAKFKPKLLLDEDIKELSRLFDKMAKLGVEVRFE